MKGDEHKLTLSGRGDDVLVVELQQVLRQAGGEGNAERPGGGQQLVGERGGAVLDQSEMSIGVM